MIEKITIDADGAVIDGTHRVVAAVAGGLVIPDEALEVAGECDRTVAIRKFRERVDAFEGGPEAAIEQARSHQPR